MVALPPRDGNGQLLSGLNDRDASKTAPFMRPILNDIHHNPGAEIVRYARGRDNMIALSMGEGDAPTPDFIIRSVQDALGRGETFYSPPLGRPELRQALSAYYLRHYGHDIPMERFFVTPSGTSAVHLALAAVLEKGDEVIAVVPMWKNLLGAMRLQQADIKPVYLDLSADGQDWVLNVERLFDAVSPNTRAIVINSPNNPTGWIMTTDQMRAVMDFARARGIWVISDEVYSRMVYGVSCAPSFLDVAEPDDRLLVINSFSKNWAMTGWRLGWLIGPKEAEQKIYDLVLYDSLCPNTFTQFGAIAALEQGEDFIAEQKIRYEHNMQIVQSYFDDIGGIIAPRTRMGFYSFFKVDGHEDCMALARNLVDQAGLVLVPGCAFGENVKGFMRMCFAVSEPRLRLALDRFATAIKR
ncbi:pyridoxal phosphate-dependent aminotransferase [Micavibrio aeruginosavorus]|uniref:Aminotransferase n=1 Tax=Micavibrio aeruginosavorus (strain ARL-13) TaxID=856793 RepID=G2KQ39_MICAA|nr:pyridoxal phosphate-dependent aminotransferase [Micavibrio aeruginosavorus]AEP08581.1 beta-eliminating lyase family protein [Micavibrio aeruginosavorus ARL-13]